MLLSTDTSGVTDDFSTKCANRWRIQPVFDHSLNQLDSESCALDSTEQTIALTTQQSSHETCFVTMIGSKAFAAFLSFLTDKADAILILVDLLPLFGSNAEVIPQVFPSCSISW